MVQGVFCEVLSDCWVIYPPEFDCRHVAQSAGFNCGLQVRRQAEQAQVVTDPGWGTVQSSGHLRLIHAFCFDDTDDVPRRVDGVDIFTVKVLSESNTWK